MAASIPSDKATADLAAIYQALDRAQAIIEFDMEGTVLAANSNFLEVFGYTLEEVVGQHHRIFCEPRYAGSSEYSEFWSQLARGELHSAEFKRLAKNGDAVWLRAS